VASTRGGIPGLAVALAAAGSYLIYCALHNVSVVDGLRSLLKGQLPTGTPSTPTPLPSYLTPGSVAAGAAAGAGTEGVGTGAAAGSAVGGGLLGGAVAGTLGQQIVSYARQYIGVPYRWGGADPSGWDCSGFVTWVLAHVGVSGLPSTTHTTSSQFMTWGGAHTVPRSQTQAGDLCCWGGHVGIAVDANNMINAPSAGIPTRIQSIYAGVTIRRLNGA
jgi:cell wall-associated NlpC family hydrolase